MQDPKKDIPSVIQTLYTTRDAKELESTIKKYYARDATFLSPLCKANSRNELLGHFQWYRLNSPKADVKVSNVMYDNDSNVLVVEVQEMVHIFFSPFSSKPGRVLVRLQLRKSNGVHLIVTEEDLIQPRDQIGFVASSLLPLADVYLRLGCILSNLGACVFRIVKLDSGLRGGKIDYQGLLEATGLSNGVKSNGNATKQ